MCDCHLWLSNKRHIYLFLVMLWLLIFVRSTDLNECLTYNGGCQHYCHNTAGSYQCACKTGYHLLDNARDCEGQIEFHKFLHIFIHIILILSFSKCLKTILEVYFQNKRTFYNNIQTFIFLSTFHRTKHLLFRAIIKIALYCHPKSFFIWHKLTLFLSTFV